MKTIPQMLLTLLAASLWLSSPSAKAGDLGSTTALSATTLARSGYLEITGTNFGSDGTLLIDGVSAPVADWQSTKIVAYVPESTRLATVPVQVVNASGQSSNNMNLTVTPRQADDQVNWSFEMDGPYSQVRPVIAADGTVYAIDVFDHLYALTPDGALKWLVQGAGNKGVAVGADGTVYVASEDAINAFNPDGSLKWTFVQNPRAFICLGVSVGPDGNIYSVGTEGMGVFSLTPAGELRWQQPESYDRLIVDYAEIVFGANGSDQQLYFYANNHLRALRLDGTSVFTIRGTFVQPAIAPDGSVHTTSAAYSPNGNLLWSLNSAGTPADIGSNGIHYFVGGPLSALNPDGSQLWQATVNGYVGGPIVDPLNTQLIMGSNETLDHAGFILSASATDGHELWRVTLPPVDGFNQTSDSRARFTADGLTAYMITFIATGNNDTSKSFVYSLNTAATSTVTPTSVVSRKKHKRAGTFDINLPLTGSAGVECRSGGANNIYQVVFTFSKAVTVSGATVTPGPGGSGTVVGGPIVSADGKTVTVNLAGVTNVQTITVTLSDVNDGTVTNDVPIQMGILIGDTVTDRTVNTTDINQVKVLVGQAVTSSTFRSDVTADGAINNSDVSLVRSKKGTTLP